MPIDRISRAALKVLHGTGIVLFVGMCLLVLAQVVARKFFEPLVWSEELARYVFIWVAFLGWLIATQRNSHIHISLVLDRSGPTRKRALAVFANLLVSVLALIFLIKGWRLVQNNMNVETVTLFFDFWLVYLVIPVSAGASIVVVGCNLLTLARGNVERKEIRL
ncbi:MAG: TRAP transporter small permease [Propionivibrio sp.]|nr:TRAP transporter small permease [Propionivibrio sp.]